MEQAYRSIISQALVDVSTASLVGKPIKLDLCDKDMPALYNLASAHSLSHLLIDGVDENSVSEQTRAKLLNQKYLAITAVEDRKFEVSELSRLFTQNKIDFIFLKGAVLSKFYPDSFIRNSCDVDVLIREPQLKLACKILQDNGYKKGFRSEHDVEFETQSGGLDELHFQLVNGNEAVDEILINVWNYAQKTQDNEYEYVLSSEFFLFYHLAHMARHFVNGGCGIRPFLDLWVMENRMNMSRDIANSLLEKCGLLKFKQGCFSLVDFWFNGEKSELASDMAEYVISGGAYGTVENRVAVSKTKKRSKLGYVWRRIFPPYREMAMFFPSLKKCPILLPWFWLVRVVRDLFLGKAKVRVQEMKANANLSEEKITEIKNLTDKLGL